MQIDNCGEDGSKAAAFRNRKLNAIKSMEANKGRTRANARANNGLREMAYLI